MNSSKFSIRMLVPILLCLFAMGPLALAQVTNASLTGLVTDSNGAALPGVQIHVQNTDTNYVQSTETNGTGVYLVTPLVPGPYKVTAEKAGFRKLVQSGITLTVDQAATLNLTLQLGDVKEVITVTADAELINTTTAEIGTTVGEEAVVELPLNGRHTSDLVLLSAGVINVLNTGGGKFQGETTMPEATGASAGGGRQGSTYYMLDGAPNMDTYMSLAAPFPDPDATEEFRVVTNNYDAHYGFAPGAIVTIQTKSGSNKLHGAAYDFTRNQLANASDYYGHNVDSLHRNIFGFSLGGPVWIPHVINGKDKLFFFGNFEHQHEGAAANNNFANFPTAKMLTGDFTEVLSNATTMQNIQGPDNAFGVDPITGNSTNIFVGSTLTPTLSPAALRLITAALPVGTAGASTNPGYTEYPGSPSIQTFQQGTARIDYKLNDKQQLFLRSFIDYYKQNGSSIPGNWIAVTPTHTGEFYNEALGHTWTINDHTVNTANVYYTQMDYLSAQQALAKDGSPVCLSKYIGATVHEIPGHCYMMGTGFNGGWKGTWSNWTEPTGERRYTYGASDAYTVTVKNQTLSAGFDLVHMFAQENTDYPATLNAQSWGNWTSFGMADFLTGSLDSFTQGGGEISSVKGWMGGAYAQDQIRIKPNLTLTVGVRWDPNTPPTVTGGRGSQWVPGQQSTMFPNAPVGMIFPGDAGLDAKLMPTQYNNWDPRVGIAFQPKFLPHTSFRAGFGIFTGPLQYSAYNHTSDIAPFSPTFSFGSITDSKHPTNDRYIPLDAPWTANYLYQAGAPRLYPTGDQFAHNNFASLSYVPPTNSPIVAPVSLGAEFSPNFKRGVTQSWNLSIEQQLTSTMALHVAYVGSESDHQSVIIDQNAATANVRPNSNFNNIDEDLSIGTSPYNSLQVGFDKRTSHGLTLQSNFTWSKVTDIASSGNISFVGGLGDPFDLKWSRGISDMNVPIVSATNFVYKTPALNGMNRVVRQILGNYEVSSIYYWRSGHPFSLYGGWCGNGGWDDCSQSAQGGDRADFAPGQIPWVGRGSKKDWFTTGYFNTKAFQQNAAQTFGNTPKNIFKGPHQQYDDMAISKHFKLAAGSDLQLRFEMFN
ncbi:MAG: TonB-dependent receptor, partial [Terracidiphilus sp.]